MIISVFCHPKQNEHRPTNKSKCALCLVKQDFHRDCIRDAKKENGHIICAECLRFIQIYFGSPDSLFEIIRLF